MALPNDLTVCSAVAVRTVGASAVSLVKPSRLPIIGAAATPGDAESVLPLLRHTAGSSGSSGADLGVSAVG
jgi:hypothetical protein